MSHRWPWQTALWYSGKVGQQAVKQLPLRCISTSMQGPMLLRSVESKVAQYLKNSWRAPCAGSTSAAASKRARASSGGAMRVF